MAEVCNNCEKGKIIEACSSDTPGRHFGYMSIYINNVPSVITSLANGHGACFQITPSVTQRQGEKSVKNDPGYDVGVNLRIEFGWTPLLVAADYGRTESLKILLEHGADPFQTLEGNLSSDKCIAIFAALYIKN